MYNAIKDIKYNQSHPSIECDPIKADKYYRVLLKNLKLTETDKEFALKQWGIDTPEEFGLISNDYKIINSFVLHIHEKNPNALKGVPGITWDGVKPKWALYSPGILIPVIQDSLIIGLILRVTAKLGKKDNKYWFTPNMFNSDYSLTKQEQNPCTFNRILITEGLAKSLIGAKRLECGHALGLTGYQKIKNDNNMWLELEMLKKQGVDTALLSFDFDKKRITRKHAKEAENDLAHLLYIHGFKVIILSWDGAKAKGIDDALNAGLEITETTFTPTKPKISMDVKTKVSLMGFEKKRAELFRRNTMPIDELRAEVANIIKSRFDTDADVWMVLGADTGSGKTTSTLKIFLDRIVNNPETRILFSLPNKDAINKYMDEISTKVPELLPYTYAFFGRGKDNCEQYELVERVGNAGHNVDATVCKTCPLLEQCKKTGYKSQYDAVLDKSIVLITHDSLGNFLIDTVESADGETTEIKKKLGSFTHVFVDEDPTNVLLTAKQIKQEAMRYARISLQRELDKTDINDSVTINQLSSCIKIFNAFESLLDAAQKNHESNHEGQMNTEQIRGLIPNITVSIAKSAFEYVKSNASKKNNTREMPSEKVDLTTGSIPLVWMHNFFRTIYEFWSNNNSYNFIRMISNKSHAYIELALLDIGLIKSLVKHKATIMDATADQAFWNKIAEYVGVTKPKYVELKAELNNQAIKYQCIKGAPASMGAINKSGKKIANTAKVIKALNRGKSVGVIATKAICDEIGDKLTGIKYGYYGKDHRYSNSYKDTDVLIVTGYQTNLNAELLKYQTLTGKMVNSQDVVKTYVPNIYSGVYELRTKTNDKNFSDYYTRKMRAEIYQAIQRARLANRDENKPLTIIYYGDVQFWPNSLPAFDEILDFSALNSEEHAVYGSKGGLSRSKTYKVGIANAIQNNAPIKKRTFNNFRNWINSLTDNVITDLASKIKVGDKVGIGVGTLKKHLASLDFIEYIKGLMNFGTKAKENKGTKIEVYTIERLTEVLKNAIPIWEEFEYLLQKALDYSAPLFGEY